MVFIKKRHRIFPMPFVVGSVETRTPDILCPRKSWSSHLLGALRDSPCFLYQTVVLFFSDLCTPSKTWSPHLLGALRVAPCFFTSHHCLHLPPAAATMFAPRQRQRCSPRSRSPALVAGCFKSKKTQDISHALCGRQC